MFNTYPLQTAEYLLTLLQNKEKHPITQLTYSSCLTNAYIQIFQILRRATSCPAQIQSAPPVISLTSVPTPSHHTVPETRVLLTPPPAALEPLVQPVPSPSSVQAPRPSDMTTYPVQEPRVQTPISPPPAAPSAVSIPAAPQFFPFDKPSSTKAVPKYSRCPVRPRLHRYCQHCYNTYYVTASQQLLAHSAVQEKYAHHIVALSTTPVSAGKQPSLREILKGPDTPVWEHGTANEFSRLLPDGIGKNRPKHDRIEGTGTIFPVRKRNIPAGIKFTYANCVCNIRPQKKETHRV